VQAASSAVSYRHVRILVTNDDGVHAPGLAAIIRSLGTWAADASPEDERHVVVAAPFANHSGASAAVGTVYERESIPYRAVQVAGAENVPTYGIDASPALSVIVGALGGFGPRPDLLISGINLGVNVGRSVLHSGTVGAALTGSQLGLSALAVSMRSGVEPVPWATAATIAVHLIPVLAGAPPRTVLNLNVPSVPLDELRGVRRGRIGPAGVIKSASSAASEAGPPASSEPVASQVSGGPATGGGDEGQIRLRLGTAIPQLGDIGDEDPEDDASLVAAGFASLTPLASVREETGTGADELVRAALAHLKSSMEA
jgi:5'-nucleotidase